MGKRPNAPDAQGAGESMQRARPKHRPPGPAPEILKIEGNWKDAVRKLISRKRPVGGWPSRKRRKRSERLMSKTAKKPKVVLVSTEGLSEEEMIKKVVAAARKAGILKDKDPKKDAK
jgi:hypothetical protein